MSALNRKRKKAKPHGDRTQLTSRADVSVEGKDAHQFQYTFRTKEKTWDLTVGLKDLGSAYKTASGRTIKDVRNIIVHEQGDHISAEDARDIWALVSAHTSGHEDAHILLSDPQQDSVLFESKVEAEFAMLAQDLLNPYRAKRLRRAERFLDGWAAVLPQRIVNEELGDYLEDINRRISAGQTWRARLRLMAAIFWTGINAIGYTVKDLIGKRQAG